jgi:NhaP-type Na+/H+ or K+/H+ antiporter
MFEHHLSHVSLQHAANNGTMSGGFFGGWDLNSFVNDERIRVQSFCLLYLIFIIVVLALGFKIILLWRIHHLPEAGIAMIVGTVFSLMTYTTGYHDIANSFDGDFFFWFLLPPIIFHSGFAQDRHPFFSNWLTIAVFANVGTLISILVFGYSMYWLGILDLSLPLPIMECLAFGALISSTDPVSTLGVFAELKVHPALRAIIYGSSALDDAVAIVMFKAFQKYIHNESLGSYTIVSVIFYLIICVLASFIIGVLFGGFAAWCIKSTNIRGEKRLLICLSVCLIYISYFACTVLELSGIISCMFAAITFKYCLEYGEILTKTDFQVVDLSLSALAYFLETFTFFAMGMSIGSKFLENHDVNLKFVFWALLFSTISRAANVYPLSYLCNLMNGKASLGICSSSSTGNSDDNEMEPSHKEVLSLDGGYDIYGKMKRTYEPHKLSLNKQHMIVFAGLRGPIAYGAAQLYPRDSPFFLNIYFATTAVVLVNIFIQGSLTEVALRVLKIDHKRNQDTAVAPLETNPCTDFTDSRGSRLMTKATNSVNDINDNENWQWRSRRDDRGYSKSNPINNTTIPPNSGAEKDLEAGEVEEEIHKEAEAQEDEDGDPGDKLVKKNRSNSKLVASDRPLNNEKLESPPNQKVEKVARKKESAVLRGSTVSALRESLRYNQTSGDCRTTKLFRKFESYVVAPLFRSDLQRDLGEELS